MPVVARPTGCSENNRKSVIFCNPFGTAFGHCYDIVLRSCVAMHIESKPEVCNIVTCQTQNLGVRVFCVV
jgi:hypothetical protein